MTSSRVIASQVAVSYKYEARTRGHMVRTILWVPATFEEVEEHMLRAIVDV